MNYCGFAILWAGSVQALKSATQQKFNSIAEAKYKKLILFTIICFLYRALNRCFNIVASHSSTV